MLKQDARTLSAAAQEAIRYRAVQAVRDGMSQTEAAHRFGVARGTVARWMKMVRQGGARALAKRRRGRPKGAGRLKGWQAAVVVRTITDRTPDQLKMPFVLWTREAVRDLIATKFQVRVSLQGLCDPRSPSGAPSGQGQEVAGPAPRVHSRVLPAGLQPRTQPRREPQQRRQGQRGRTTTPRRPRGNDGRCSWLKLSPLAGQFSRLIKADLAPCQGAFFSATEI